MSIYETNSNRDQGPSVPSFGPAPRDPLNQEKVVKLLPQGVGGVISDGFSLPDTSHPGHLTQVIQGGACDFATQRY